MRERAADFILSYVHAEDVQTNHIDIGPVNKVINMCCTFLGDGPDSERFRRHVDRLDDYLWVAEDGMKMQGYNGTQLWDVSFSVMALLESPTVAAAFAPTFTSWSLFEIVYSRDTGVRF